VFDRSFRTVQVGQAEVRSALFGGQQRHFFSVTIY
jgi:hypothetical protein